MIPPSDFNDHSSTKRQHESSTQQMSQTEILRAEGHFEGDLPVGEIPRAGGELFFQSWTSKFAHTTLVLTHGIAEHSDAYARTAEALIPMGYEIYAMDLRGHGRSEGRRGYIDDFGRFSRDLEKFITYLQNPHHGPLKNSRKPIVMIGHSMGALITLRLLVEWGPLAPVHACVLSSPAMGISMPVPALKELAAKALLKWLPQVTLPNDIKYEHLTHDESLWSKYPSDPLRHDKISPAMYFGMLEAMETVRLGAGRIQLPILMQLAGDERIVSRPDSEALYACLGSLKKELRIYEKSYHEIYNDFDRDQAFQDLDGFLVSTLKKQDQAPSETPRSQASVSPQSGKGSNT
jgi:alpha-beta hydrolase superfamily lysophospholipase